GFGDQPALVLAGDGGGVDLDELGIAVPRARLETARRGPAGADHRHRRFPEYKPVSAGRHDDGVGAEGFDLHRPHVLGDDADAGAVVNDRPEEFPELVLVDLTFGLVPAGLLVEGVEELLASRRAGEERAFEERTAEE